MARQLLRLRRVLGVHPGDARGEQDHRVGPARSFGGRVGDGGGPRELRLGEDDLREAELGREPPPDRLGFRGDAAQVAGPWDVRRQRPCRVPQLRDDRAPVGRIRGGGLGAGPGRSTAPCSCPPRTAGRRGQRDRRQGPPGHTRGRDEPHRADHQTDVVSAIPLALDAVTVTLLLLFREHTVGLFAWGSGSLSQYGGEGLAWMTPVVLVGVVGLFALAGRLDVHGLGDDAAAALGLQPKHTRRAVVLLAVALSAASVTVAGPVGFVGLAAPAIVRLLGPRVPGLLRHRALLPASALSGVVVVLGADVVVRWAPRWAASRCRRASSPRWWARCSWCCSPPGSAARARCGPPRRRCAGGGWPWW